MGGELVFYTNPMSRGRIAHWMLEEVGAPYRTEYLDFGAAMSTPAYLAINPLGKVPAVRHGERVVTECAAICAYLADAFPEAGLAPPPGDRADYYRWLFFASGPLEAAVTNRSLSVEVPDERRGMVGYAPFARMMDALETAVRGKAFVAGERFSAADVYVGSHIGWGMQFGTIENRPAFREYFARVADRPARARANAQDDAAMPARTAAG
jgi:glutathione S-transferase